MTTLRRFLPVLLAGTVCFAAGIAAAGEQPGFFRDGDVWAFLGDSITHADTYRRTVQRVFRHFHPGANVRLTQKGKSGALARASKEQFEKADKADRPTIVSLMTGMNNSINSSWKAGAPMDKHLAGYRREITAFARTVKDKGITPVLMSPTLTDESLGWYSMWALDGTAEFLRRCGRIVKEVAEAEGVLYVPVAEDFEAAQNAALPEQVFRHDGVHPSAMGQYMIARSLLRRMNFPGRLLAADAERKLGGPPPPLPVELKLAERFLHNGDDKIAFVLTGKTEKPLEVTATWSFGDRRGSEKLKIAGTATWTLKLPAPLDLEMGAADDVVIDLTDGKGMGLYLVDLCRTRVVHLADGKVRGTIEGPAGRPEGVKAVDWTLRVVGGKWLLLEAEVFDSEIRTDTDWPWAQDGLAVWLDYRPTARFADVGLDAEVYMVMLHPYKTPRFAVGLRPWLGRGIYAAGVAGGTKTPTGYRCHLSIADGGKGQMRRFSKWMSSDLSKRDFVGFSIVHTDCDTGKGGRAVGEYNLLQKTDQAHDKYANTLIILDLKGKLPGESVINAHLARLLP
ncbi:MAG TPA: GDSL-type esterase/lipase family protein [Phycisphaerae bacterium]|nr:GDSL-type esterase/lipase family protein [Phycisphaerae bacterium]